MKAKLFANGGSQAVRLPAAFRFEGSEVEIERDPASGAVILRPLRPSVQVWLFQRASLVHPLRQVLPLLAPAIAEPRLVGGPAWVPPLGQLLLLDPAALGALLCGMDFQLDDWLRQGRCAVAAVHALAIERALAALDEPLITAFVQQGLDLCISLPWTAACSRKLAAIAPDPSAKGSGSSLAHQDLPLPLLLAAQAQVSGAVLVREL
jgi:virulence-associated protein VagC